MESLSQRLRQRQSFCEMLEALLTLYESETYEPSKYSKGESMSMPGKIQQHVSKKPAFEGFLRRLGVSPGAAVTEEGSGRVLREKKEQLLDHWTDMSAPTGSGLARLLAAMDSASQLLSCSLNRDAPLGWSLWNSEQEEKFLMLESELGLVQRGIEGLDLDVLQNVKTRDRFVERWSLH